MTTIRFRDQKRSDDEKGEKDSAKLAGQVGMTEEQFKLLLESLGTTAPQEQGRTQPQNTARSTHEQLGLNDNQMAKLSKALGEDVAEILLGTLGSMRGEAERTDALILGQVEEMNEGINSQFEEQKKALEGLGRPSVDPSITLGLDRVFTEDNKDDVAEMLDLLTQRSGGLFNAREAFDTAADNGDYKTLMDFKEKFQGFVESKYKSHESVAGGKSTATYATKESQKVESEIDALNKQIDSILSGPNKDTAKVLELQGQVKEKLETLVN